MAKRLALMLSVFAVVGCDRPSTSGDGGPDGVDAAPSDGGRHDAGPEDDDAGPSPDPDASTPRDAGPPDAGPEPCDIPGATETVPHMPQGTVERFCQASGTWAYGACTDEGECAPGTIESTACGNCGSQQRRCTTACAWETVGTCTGSGECAPGTMVTTQDGCPPDQARQLLCNSACTFEVTAACAAETCTTPGATEELLPCGTMCGTRDRFCTSAHVWEYGACTGEGVCVPGTTGTLPCGRCGTQTARCTAECGWMPTSSCTGEGVCTPGTVTTTGSGCPTGQARQLVCNAACALEASACSSERCVTPGSLERQACGMCGTRDRFCTSSYLWDDGPCTSEGVCEPGATTGTLPCGMCGTRAAVCTTECGWTPTSACTGEGVCMPGARQRTTMGCAGGQTRLVECDTSCGYSIEIEPCRTSVPIDVLFLVDATGSNWSEFSSERATFISSCVDPLLAITDVSVGLAYYGDIGSFPETFVGAVELGGATSGAISTSIAAESGFGGADDSTMEALHILTGGTPQPGAVPFTCSAGRVAGGCWRPGAERVIVMHTDEVAKGGPDPASTGLYSPWPTGPTWTTVLPRLMTDDTSMFVIYDEDDALGTAQYREMIADLGQPASDYHQQGGTASISSFCSAIVARVRTMAGM